ncbi:MAG: hypothetical protein JRI23_13035 [Deltaproteobacteria bacterium]|nr:hypothetical protein [Deltaproteobacteria bacterium]MBW2532643.1 hypothetical protein [Deltaproteobacteria bacterium]
MSFHSHCLPTLLLALSMGTASAHAQPKASDLFDKGLELMMEGKHDKACPLLAHSFGLEPLPGALFTLAECNARWGKPATAIVQFRDFIDRVKRMPVAEQNAQKKRLGLAEGRLKELGSQVGKITIELTAVAPERAVVRRNGQPVPPAQLGKPLQVDPGRQTVSVELDGKVVEELSRIVGPGKDVTFAMELTRIPSGQSEQPDPPPEEPAKEPAPAEPDSIGISPAWALVAAAVGVVGFGVGIGTGAAALGKKDEIFDNCTDDRVCSNQDGIDAADEGQTLAAVSTVGFGVGIAGAGAAVILWLVADDGEAPADTARIRPYARGSHGGLEVAW